jgi:hypothetical protein
VGWVQVTEYMLQGWDRVEVLMNPQSHKSGAFLE